MTDADHGERPVRVLVVGTERSGTTWIARVIAASRDAIYVHEPDNPDASPGARFARAHSLYPVLAPGDEAALYEHDWDFAFNGWWPNRRWTAQVGKTIRMLPEAIREPLLQFGTRLVGELRRPPPIVVAKTVHGVFSAEWLVDRYEPRVVVVHRDPIGIVASLVELGTTEAHLRRLYDFYDDPTARDRFIEPLGLPAPPTSLDLLERCAWWVATEQAALTLQAKRGNWPIVDYDELTRTAVRGFRLLYDRLDLEWTDAAAAMINALDREGSGFQPERRTRDAAERWRRTLDDDGTEVVRRTLHEFDEHSRSGRRL